MTSTIYHDETGSVIGYIWPKLTRCPHCGSEEWMAAGYSKAHEPDASTGSIYYRRCANAARPECPSRLAPYKVLAIAIHVDRGGDQSEVLPL